MNMTMKMVSAVSVSNRKAALSDLVESLSPYAIANKQYWYRGELSELVIYSI